MYKALLLCAYYYAFPYACIPIVAWFATGAPQPVKSVVLGYSAIRPPTGRLTSPGQLGSKLRQADLQQSEAMTSFLSESDMTSLIVSSGFKPAQFRGGMLYAAEEEPERTRSTTPNARFRRDGSGCCGRCLALLCLRSDDGSSSDSEASVVGGVGCPYESMESAMDTLLRDSQTSAASIRSPPPFRPAEWGNSRLEANSSHVISTKASNRYLEAMPADWRQENVSFSTNS